MFFFARLPERNQILAPDRAIVSLGLFAGHPADSARVDGDIFAELPQPRAKMRAGWRPDCSPSGWHTLFCGWIDNQAEIACELRLSPNASAAQIYGAAVERWDDEADSHLIGCYASLVALPNGEVRLARSPWGSRSLFYWSEGADLLVCSIPRPLFAAGIEKRLRPAALDSILAYDLPDHEESFFEGIRTFRSGSILRLNGTHRTAHAFYDPARIAPVKFSRDEEYVEAANALLSDAVKAALRGASRPGVALSGGLDSSIVCDEILKNRDDRKVTSFTFGPLPEWDGHVAKHKFGDDRPYVSEFAKMHPELDVVFVDNRGIDWDYRENEMFLACDGFYPAQTLSSVYYGLYEAAKDRGCDIILFAEAGNVTYSNSAPWAFAEYLRKGHWRQLWRLAQARQNDPRPMWRRIAALGLMPNLPHRLRSQVRRWVHGKPGRDPYANSLLRPEGRLGRYSKRDIDDVTICSYGNLASQEDFVRILYETSGVAAELGEVSAQVFGILGRDVTTYRPLIEFCCGVPTNQYARDGVSRLLARRMAVNRMPEAQRLNTLYGEHNVDWHARQSCRLADLRAGILHIRDHPQLGSLIDTDLALSVLANWPERTPDDYALQSLMKFDLPAMISVARYLDFVTGRNPN